MTRLVRSWSSKTRLVNPKSRRKRIKTTQAQIAAARRNLEKARLAKSKKANWIKGMIKSGKFYKERMGNGKWGVFSR
jgi:hypothetical protein